MQAVLNTSINGKFVESFGAMLSVVKIKILFVLCRSTSEKYYSFLSKNK